MEERTNIPALQAPAMGVDIGNGFGYVSILDEDAKDPIILLSDDMRRSGMPTSAYVDSNGAITVLNASQNILRYPNRAIHAVKQQLENGETLALPGPGKEMTVSVDEAYTAVVRDLLSVAAKERSRMGGQPVTDLALTYPVEFRDRPDLLDRMQRSVESIAAADGGHYRVVGRLPEPAAVAFDYLYYMRHLAAEENRISEDEFTVLVYDLGHGTFDTALVTAKDGTDQYTVHASDGLRDVGGKNFEEILMEELLRQLKERYDFTPGGSRREELRRLAVRMKHELSEKEICEDDSSYSLPDEYAEFTVTREQFEEMTSHLLDETLMKTERMIRYAQQHQIKVDCIVLSGGGSRMPMVKNALLDLANGLRVEMHRPSAAVSFGAARFARQCSRKERIEPETEQTQAATLAQKAEYAYGLTRQMQNSIRDEVVFLTNSDDELPAVSGELEFMAEGSGVVRAIISRHKERGMNPKAAPIEDCWEIIRIPFEIAPFQKCKLSFEITEGRDVLARMVTADGKITQTKRIADVQLKKEGNA